VAQESKDQQDVYIERAEFPGGQFMENVRVRGATRAGVAIGDGPDPDPSGGPVDFLVLGKQGHLRLEAESHAPTMMSGGSIGRLSGQLRHRPGAKTFGYSANEPGKECPACGFAAYKWSATCAKCGRGLS
jgi:hypothetical protein